MVLVHTAGTLLAGVPRTRNWAKYRNGAIIKRQYKLAQPQVHSIYRGGFSAVDIFNKVALGPNSCVKAFRSKQWTHRFFSALLSMSEANAYLVHKQRHESKGKRARDHAAWREELAWKLIGTDIHETQGYSRSTLREGRATTATEGRLGLRHCTLLQRDNRTNPHCCVCGEKKTSYFCADCGHNAPLCPNFVSRDCVLAHMLDCLEVADFAGAITERQAACGLTQGTQASSGDD